MKIEIVAPQRCRTGEGPLWDEASGCLYWTDIPAGRLYRHRPATGLTETVYEGRPVGGFTLQLDGSLLLFRDRGNVACWREGKVDTLLEDQTELSSTRFNDVCADKAGRVYCGTMSSEELSGRLYRLERDGRLVLLSEGWGTPNGMGFDAEGKTLFYNDSRAARTHRFDVDEASGALSAGRVFRDAKVAGDPGRPDGLALDRQGGVWTARWDGGCLLRFQEHDAALSCRIDLPVRHVTSLCFGGERLEDLYVTTAKDPEDGTRDADGALFRVRDCGFSGLPRFRSRIPAS